MMLNRPHFFDIRWNSRSRGCNRDLGKNSVRRGGGYHGLSDRVVDIWNRLSKSGVNVDGIRRFRSPYGRRMRLSGLPRVCISLPACTDRNNTHKH